MTMTYDSLADELDMHPLTMPRKRRPPASLSGPATAYHAPTVEDHYGTPQFTMKSSTPAASQQLTERFDDSASGLATYSLLSNILMTGDVDTELVEKYPELHVRHLSIQLAMFRTQFEYKDLEQCREIIQNMAPEVRSMSCEVERLCRLLLVCPVSSCESERSFSALRRLKTWLRNSMTQPRLNAVALCHIHQ